MPVHSHILENIHALLDFNQVSKVKKERIKYFSKIFEIPVNISAQVLEGEIVPDKKLLKEIADKFEVDTNWLLKN